MAKGCTPDAVDGALVGLADAQNAAINFADIEDLTPEALDRMTEISARGKAAEHDYNPSIFGQMLDYPDEVKNLVKGVIQDVRNPSGIFGEDFVQPVHQFMVSHLEEFGDDLMSAESRQVYFDTIDDILEELPDVADELHYASDRYKQYYKNGGEFFNRDNSGAVTGAVSNVVGHTLQSSPTVVVGNVAEGAIKLPTLYPKTLLPAIKKVIEKTNGKIWETIPELEAKGVYGSSLGIETSLLGSRKSGGFLKNGLIGITDNPLKNISYYAGELAQSGNGLKAVQEIAFVPRLGDIPSIYYSGKGRAAISLLGYTVNSYKMYGQMYKNLFKGATPAIRKKAAQELITFHVMSGVIGGGVGAILPKPVEAAITAIFPESEDILDQQNKLAGLTQFGGIDEIGVAYNMASRKGDKVVKSVKQGLEAAGEGDIKTVAIEGLHSFLSLAPFTSNFMGDAQIQKIIEMGRDFAMGELDIEDVPEQAIENITPYALRN